MFTNIWMDFTARGNQNMIHKGTEFTLFGKVIEKVPFFEGIELLYFTDITFGNFLMHVHDHVEIMLILDGDVELVVEDERYQIPRGSLVLTPPQLLHHTLVPEKTKRYERLVLHIFLEYLEQIIRCFPAEEHCFDFCRQVQIIRYSPDTFWIFRTLFERALYAQNQSPQYQKLVIPCLMVELFMEMEHTLKNQTSPLIPITNNLVSSVVDYIDEHFTEPDLTMAQIHQSLFVSQGYLSRVFKSYTGSTIYNFLSCKRLAYSAELLASGHSVLEACISCGFTDYTSFLKAFKKNYEITPSQYRKQHLKTG